MYKSKTFQVEPIRNVYLQVKNCAKFKKHIIESESNQRLESLILCRTRLFINWNLFNPRFGYVELHTNAYKTYRNFIHTDGEIAR